MRNFICHRIHLGLIVALMFPLPARAMPAITCHCFTERSYDAAHPAAADPYFLATAQNSFLAQVFAIDKKSVVIKKQQGTASDDLWIAQWLAAQSGSSVDSLLQAKQKNGAWKDVVVPLRLTSKTLGTRFSNALSARSSTAQLAEAVVDELLVRHRLLGEPELATLRQTGVPNQELILAALIAAKTKQPVRQICLEVKSGSKTWGALLQGARIDPKNIQQEFVAILKR